MAKPKTLPNHHTDKTPRGNLLRDKTLEGRVSETTASQFHHWFSCYSCCCCFSFRGAMSWHNIQPNKLIASLSPFAI